MKKIFLALLLPLLMPYSQLSAQRSEVGIFGGGSFYLGDINPSKLFSQTKPAAGILYRYHLSTRWSIKGSFTSATVAGDDAKFDNPRNLNFRNQINELSCQVEFNFLPYFTGSRRSYKFSPYLFAGASLFFHNPKAYYYDPFTEIGRWVALQPLATEGQGLMAYPERKTYNLAQFAIPFGLGFKYSLSPRFGIGVEWGMRMTFTDYLDDVSTTYANPTHLNAEIGGMSAELADRSVVPNAIGSARGNAKTNDWYSFAGVSLSFRFNKARERNCPAFPASVVKKYKVQDK